MSSLHSKSGQPSTKFPSTKKQTHNQQNDTDLEEFPQSNIVQTVGAVEDDALFGHCLGQILRGLRLSSPGRTLGSTAQMQMQRPEQRPITPIGQRSDDQTPGVAQILVTVAARKVDENEYRTKISACECDMLAKRVGW